MTFEETETEVIWSGFYNDTQMDYDRSLYPVFRFEKGHYEAALAQLKVIADEGYTVGEDKEDTV